MSVLVYGLNPCSLRMIHQLAQTDLDLILASREGALLARLRRRYDVSTLLIEKGKVQDQLLQQLRDINPSALRLFLAMSLDETCNIHLSHLAQSICSTRTVALLDACEYPSWTEYFRLSAPLLPNMWIARQLKGQLLFPRCPIQPLPIFSEEEGYLSQYTLCCTVPEQHEVSIVDDFCSILGGRIISPDLRIIQVIRDGVSWFPRGNEEILEGDEMVCVGSLPTLVELFRLLRLDVPPFRGITLVGGSPVSIALAYELRATNIDFYLMEDDPKKCHFLAKRAPWIDVRHEDASDPEVWLQRECKPRKVVLLSNEDDYNASVARSLLSARVHCITALFRQEVFFSMMKLQQDEIDPSHPMNILNYWNVLDPYLLFVMDRAMKLFRRGKENQRSPPEGHLSLVYTEITIPLHSPTIGVSIARLREEAPCPFFVLYLISSSPRKMRRVEGSTLVWVEDQLNLIVYQQDVASLRTFFSQGHLKPTLKE